MSAAAPDVTALLEATWPAERHADCGPFRLNFSPGGGKRVQAAVMTAGAAPSAADLDAADAAMRAVGQVPLYRVLPDQPRLDAALQARGLARVDETLLLHTPLAPLLSIETPRLTAFDIWPPMAIMEEIWDQAGIGADRRAVMARCAGPHTALMGRVKDRVGGVGFAALHAGTVVVHALETVPALRRAGVARRLIGHAAQWGDRQGARALAVLVTAANAPARAFYSSLGMEECGGYHYRICTGGEIDAR